MLRQGLSNLVSGAVEFVAADRAGMLASCMDDLDTVDLDKLVRLLDELTDLPCLTLDVVCSFKSVATPGAFAPPR
jgi:hypothetical protein